ncbi:MULTISPECIES: hypothetical protein [Actinomycetes]|uniref:Uncharacterized protein n=1 Tax=Parafrankia colletiae TaxID=573497 RepID=A0A1S1R3W3_9ACTN|nr:MULTISPECIES: hypothetical protein [Actinomycetes]MCK9901362.1 hypothetical protein [Frankia sp. Cpl3]OHV40185.1 hypothetical protein CC117_33675 [Parafrankia colletiae]TLK48004.1 hypothetical protein FDN03_15425 [Glutamicibacter sp. V16R2B1]
MSRIPEQEHELRVLLDMDIESMTGDAPHQWARRVHELAPEMADKIWISGQPDVETEGQR